MSDLYDKDFYTWAMTQADAAKRRAANEVDWENVAEELEGLGKSQASELRSRYEILLLHLLKWLHQPTHRSRSWRNTINHERLKVSEHLDENPGLQPRQAELFAKAYRAARFAAANETGLEVETFPQANPFTLEQAMHEDFWPDG